MYCQWQSENDASGASTSERLHMHSARTERLDVIVRDGQQLCIIDSWSEFRVRMKRSATPNGLSEDSYFALVVGNFAPMPLRYKADSNVANVANLS